MTNKRRVEEINGNRKPTREAKRFVTIGQGRIPAVNPTHTDEQKRASASTRSGEIRSVIRSSGGARRGEGESEGEGEGEDLDASGGGIFSLKVRPRR